MRGGSLEIPQNTGYWVVILTGFKLEGLIADADTAALIRVCQIHVGQLRSKLWTQFSKLLRVLGLRLKQNIVSICIRVKMNLKQNIKTINKLWNREWHGMKNVGPEPSRAKTTLTKPRTAEPKSRPAEYCGIPSIQDPEPRFWTDLETSYRGFTTVLCGTQHRSTPCRSL